MLKLELDWASDESVDERSAQFDDEQVFTEFDAKPGAAGWPTVRVYVREVEGEPAYVKYMRLDGWLQDVYGASEDEAQELAGLADEV